MQSKKTNSKSQTLKGSLKEYHRWIDDEIQDYAYTPEPIDLSKMNLDRFTQSIDVQNSFKNKETAFAKRFLKYQSSTDFLAVWKSFPLKIMEKILMLLKAEEICALIITCKSFRSLLDTEKTWKKLFARDFSDFIGQYGCLPKYPKQLYRYIKYMNRSEINFHTGIANSESSSLWNRLLMTSLVDVMSLKDLSLARYVHQFISTNVRNPETWQNDLKVSWLKETTEVVVWIGGLHYPIGKRKPDEPNSICIRQALQTSCFLHYRFFDEEQICNVFFLEPKYLVIEIKELKAKEKELEKDLNKSNDVKKQEEEEEEKKKKEQGLKSEEQLIHTFIIVNLEQEFKCKLDVQGRPEPFRCRFTTGSPRDNESKNLNQDILICDIKFKEIEGDKSNIFLKVVNQEEILFFTKGTNKTFVVGVNPAKKEKTYQFCLELDDLLVELLISKRIQIHSGIKLFAIDQSLKVYRIDCSHQRDLNVKMIPLISTTEDGIETKLDEDNSENSLVQKYHHGLYSNNLEEYLVVEQKGSQNFYVINLQTLGFYTFNPSLSQHLKNYGPTITWDIYEDKFWFLTATHLNVSRFPTPDSTLSVLSSKAVEGFQPMGSSDRWWLLLGPYYSMIIQVIFYKCVDNEIYISIFPTYQIFAGGDHIHMTLCYKLHVQNAFPADFTREPAILNHFVDVKFKDNILFIKRWNDDSSFFCDLEAYRKESDNKRCDSTVQKIILNRMTEKNVEEEPERKERVKLVTYQKLEDNLNHSTVPKVKVPANSQKSEKKEDKKGLKPKNKGPKYYKNVRQNANSDKYSI